MSETRAELLARAAQIRDERRTNFNTPQRVGEALYEIVDSMVLGTFDNPVDPTDNGKMLYASAGAWTKTAAPSAAGQTVVWNGSVWAPGALDLADSDAVTGVLPAANGGLAAPANPADDGKVIYASAGAWTKSTTLKSDGAAILFGASPSTGTGLIKTEHAVVVVNGKSSGGVNTALMRWGSTADVLQLGDSTNTLGVQLNGAAAASHSMRHAGATEYTFSSTQADFKDNEIIFNATAATGGKLNFAHNSTLAVGRTNGGSNATLATWGASTDLLTLGSTGVANLTANIASGGSYKLQHNGTDEYTFSNTVATFGTNQLSLSTVAGSGGEILWNDDAGANSGALPSSGRNRIPDGGTAFLVGRNFTNTLNVALITWTGNSLRIGSTSVTGAAGIDIISASASPTTITCGTAVYTFNSGAGGFAFNSVNACQFNGTFQALYANNTITAEVTYLGSARRVVALGRGSQMTTTEMPTNTGDLVTYVGNAATAPSAVIGTNPPVSGAIFFAEGGGLSSINTGNVRRDLAPADQGGTSNWTASKVLYRSKRGNTTNNTPTQLDTYTLGTNSVATVRARVRARDRTADDQAWYQIAAGFKRRAGGTTIVGSAVVDSGESDAAWDATLDASGNDIRVTITGDSVNTVDWDVDWEIHLSTV